ncbi:MAG: hypothetical protein PWQ88_590 [Candidatus Methanomethylophilaceae archaeon]|nr:hypothetical protein [Candidatus Methanomethylophilaceae archaeon]MDI3541575.1 hypothetical protein [Candidatus Methanomethylophilaceae archaeon]
MIEITVRNAENGSTLNMEVEPHTTIEDIIEGAAEFWQKEAGAYVLRRGKRLLKGQSTVQDAELKNKDVLELIPDPEGG